MPYNDVEHYLQLNFACFGHMLGVSISETKENMTQTKTLVLSWKLCKHYLQLCYNPCKFLFYKWTDRIAQGFKVEPGNPVTMLSIFSPLLERRRKCPYVILTAFPDIFLSYTL